MIDGMLLPRNRMIGAEHDLACADLRHQMPKRLRGKYQRVEMQLVEIFGRLLLQLDVRIAVLRRYKTRAIGPRRIGAEIAAAMRGKNFQFGKAVQRSLKNQMLQGDRGIERIADGIRQPAIALETLGQFRRTYRVNEQHSAEFFRLRPHRMKFGIGEILAQDIAADRRTPQALLLDGMFQLLHGEIRILLSERGDRGEAVRLRYAQCREFL